MTELISRQAAQAIKVLPKCYREYKTDILDDAYEQGWTDAMFSLNALPTIEPKKGKWIPKTLYPLSFSDGECKDCVQCSNCKKHWDFETNYCPNCGAQMEEAGDDPEE